VYTLFQRWEQKAHNTIGIISLAACIASIQRVWNNLEQITTHTKKNWIEKVTKFWTSFKDSNLKFKFKVVLLKISVNWSLILATKIYSSFESSIQKLGTKLRERKWKLTSLLLSKLCL